VPDPVAATIEDGDAPPPDSPAPPVHAQTTETLKGLFGRDSLYMLLWGVQIGIAALSTPIITRALGVSQFGRVAATLAVVQVLVALSSFSLQSAVQRIFAGEGGERDARRVITLAVVLALGLLGVVYATGPAWCAALGLGRFGLTLQYGAVWACLWAITNASLGLIRSHDKLRAFGIITLLQSVVAEVLGLLLVLLVHRTAAEYLLGHLIAQTAAVGVALFVARPLALRRRDLPTLAGALHYSLGLVPAALASFVLDSSDRLIVQRDLGPAAVARYAVAYNIASLTIVLLYVLNSVWMPRVFALSEPSVRNAVLAASRDVLYALLIPVVVGLCAFSPIILRIWVPASYRPEGLLLIVAIVAVTAFPYAGMMAATRVLLFSGNTVAVGVSAVVAALANIGLNLLLDPTLGIGGAALATFCSFSLLFGLLALRARGIMRLRRPQAMLVAKIFAAIVISVASTQLPSGVAFTAVRVLVAFGCLIAFAAMLTAVLAPKRHALAERVAALIHSTDVAVPA
jgi:O-antigen/teichoic acid export membrane protein